MPCRLEQTSRSHLILVAENGSDCQNVTAPQYRAICVGRLDAIQYEVAGYVELPKKQTRDSKEVRVNKVSGSELNETMYVQYSNISDKRCIK